MKMNCTWHFNNSVKNSTCIGTFEVEGKFGQAHIYWFVICALNAFLAFTAAFGNSAILLTIWKTSSLHTLTNTLLASLALSDLAVGLVVQPLFIAYLLSEIDILTLLFSVSSDCLCWASLITITAITVDRLLVLQLHLRYDALVTPLRMTWVVIFIWMSSGVSALLSSLNLTLFFILEFVATISVLVGNFAVYIKIYLIVRRHHRQIQHQFHQHQQMQQATNGNIFRVTLRFKKTALNTFLVYILLLCCYMPYCLALLSGNISPSVYITTLTLIFLNSSLNPLLYCWRDRDIRTAIKRLFGG